MQHVLTIKNPLKRRNDRALIYLACFLPFNDSALGFICYKLTEILCLFGFNISITMHM